MEDFKKEGYVYVPYTIENTGAFVNGVRVSGEETEREREYDKFMKQYRIQHKYCPKCGSVRHTSTLMGYILNMDHKDEYKDLNRCTCNDCGDIHTTHDRVKDHKYNTIS